MNLHSQIMSLRLQFDAELEEAKQAAYAEGRKDEREASCVDELVAALKALLDGLDRTNWSSWQVTHHFSAEQEAARALLTKLEQS